MRSGTNNARGETSMATGETPEEQETEPAPEVAAPVETAKTKGYDQETGEFVR